MGVLNVLAQCFLTGIVTGLTLWGLAKVGLVPVIGIMYINKEEDEEQE